MINDFILRVPSGKPYVMIASALTWRCCSSVRDRASKHHCSESRRPGRVSIRTLKSASRTSWVRLFVSSLLPLSRVEGLGGGGRMLSSCRESGLSPPVIRPGCCGVDQGLLHSSACWSWTICRDHALAFVALSLPLPSVFSGTAWSFHPPFSYSDCGLLSTPSSWLCWICEWVCEPSHAPPPHPLPVAPSPLLRGGMLWTRDTGGKTSVP